MPCSCGGWKPARVRARGVVGAGADRAREVGRGRVHARVEHRDGDAGPPGALPGRGGLDLVQCLQLVRPDLREVRRRRRDVGDALAAVSGFAAFAAGPFGGAAADRHRPGQRRGDGGHQLARRVEDRVPALVGRVRGPAVGVAGDREHHVRAGQLRRGRLPRRVVEQRGRRPRDGERAQSRGRVADQRQPGVESVGFGGGREGQDADRVDRAGELVGVVRADAGDAAVAFGLAEQRAVDRLGAGYTRVDADPGGCLLGPQAGCVPGRGREDLARRHALPALRHPGGDRRGELGFRGLPGLRGVRLPAREGGHGHTRHSGCHAGGDPHRAP